MDYIQEELRRQRAALARVLLGGGFPQSGADGEGAAAALRTAAAAAETVLAPVRGVVFRPAEGDAASNGDGGWAVPGIPGYRARTAVHGERAASGETAEFARRDGWAGPAGYGRQSGEAGHLAGTVPPGLAGGGQAEETAGPTAARRTAGGAVLEQRVPEFVPAAGGGERAVEAEALSRTFQRDARRYDGGFAMY